MRQLSSAFVLAAMAAAGVAQSGAASARDGEVCVSRWNSTNSYFIDAVKSRLREPASFKHIQTVVGPLTPQGFYIGKMKYRYAERGRTTIAVATARLDRTTCKATLI